MIVILDNLQHNPSSYDEHVLFKNWLFDSFQIRTQINVSKKRKNQFYWTFFAKDFRHFIKLLEPIVSKVLSLMYKLKKDRKKVLSLMYKLKKDGKYMFLKQNWMSLKHNETCFKQNKTFLKNNWTSLKQKKQWVFENFERLSPFFECKFSCFFLVCTPGNKNKDKESLQKWKAFEYMSPLHSTLWTRSLLTRNAHFPRSLPCDFLLHSQFSWHLSSWEKHFRNIQQSSPKGRLWTPSPCLKEGKKGDISKSRFPISRYARPPNNPSSQKFRNGRTLDQQRDLQSLWSQIRTPKLMLIWRSSKTFKPMFLCLLTSMNALELRLKNLKTCLIPNSKRAKTKIHFSKVDIQPIEILFELSAEPPR